MFKNVDELLLCRSYVGIWGFLAGRLHSYRGLLLDLWLTAKGSSTVCQRLITVLEINGKKQQYFIEIDQIY